MASMTASLSSGRAGAKSIVPALSTPRETVTRTVLALTALVALSSPTYVTTAKSASDSESTPTTLEFSRIDDTWGAAYLAATLPNPAPGTPM